MKKENNEVNIKSNGNCGQSYIRSITALSDKNIKDNKMYNCLNKVNCTTTFSFIL